LLGNTSPDISSMVTMRVEVSASAVAAEVEEALARVERARGAHRGHRARRARETAFETLGRGVRPGRVGLCARETRCVCVCADSITFFRGAGPGARGDSDRARLESHERAIVAR
jgi:hypothetical protein